MGDHTQVFKQASHLHGVAKIFHEIVAEKAGLLLEDLVRMVYKFEKILIQFEKDRRRRSKEAEEMHDEMDLD